MSNTVQVVCGSCQKTLKIPDKYAGKSVRCPGCQEPISVPALATVPTEGDPFAAGAPADDDDVEFLDDDESEAAPRMPSRTTDKAAKPEPAKAGGAFGMEKGMLSSGVWGGIGLMIGAIVWFVLGLMADRIFFYPPIMFLIGLVAFFKALLGGSR